MGDDVMSRRKRGKSTDLTRIEHSIEEQLRIADGHATGCACKVCLEVYGDDEFESRVYVPSTSKKYVPPEPEARVRLSAEERAELEAVDPPRDPKTGEVLTLEDIEEALVSLKDKERSIDADVLSTKHPEQQANRVRNLHNRYKDHRLFLESLRRQAKRYEQYQRDLLGYRSYGFDADTDQAISKVMDEAMEEYFQRVDDLKDVVAKRIRACLDELGDEVNDTILRERLYRELHIAGVMGDWEPMEF